MSTDLTPQQVVETVGQTARTFASEHIAAALTAALDAYKRMQSLWTMIALWEAEIAAAAASDDPAVLVFNAGQRRCVETIRTVLEVPRDD